MFRLFNICFTSTKCTGLFASNVRHIKPYRIGLYVLEVRVFSFGNRLNFQGNRALHPIREQFLGITDQEINLLWCQPPPHYERNTNVIELTFYDYFAA